MSTEEPDTLKVVPIRELPVGLSPETTVNSNAVAKLESLLARAKRGEIDSVAVAYTCPNRGFNTDWSSASPLSSTSMVAAVTQLFWEFCSHKFKR